MSNPNFSFKQILVFLVAFFPVFVTAQSSSILQTSFESNTLGSINNQGDWNIEQGKAEVVSDSNLVHSGQKALRFIASNEKLVVNNTSFSGNQEGVSGVVYVDLYVKVSSILVKDFAISGYDLFGGSAKRSFVFEFDTPSGNTGDFRIYNGSSKLTIVKYNLGEWNRISARIDYENENYQVIFNGSDAVSASFRESYTPTASGSRKAGIKEYHSVKFNLGYDGATGSADAAVDDIYIGTEPISDVIFPNIIMKYTIDIEQPVVGQITVDPLLDEYPDSTEVTATLTLPSGYKNSGWTGDLSGDELQKTFLITKNMRIGADVEIDTTNPPAQYTVSVTQPDTGKITLSPEGGVYYDYTTVTAKLTVPIGWINSGWTGDLSGTNLEQKFIVHSNMVIGAVVVQDTTPPKIYTVSSASDLKSTCKGTNLKPGDIVEVEDGSYDTGGITVESSGTADKKIIIRSKNIGGAELSGESYFTFRKNEHVILEGFRFTSNKYTVVKLEACNNIQITKNTFEITESEGQNGKWVYIGGFYADGSILSHHNRIDHNIFKNKHQLGNFITIDGGDSVSQHDRIDHNYFYNIGPRHENEMEAIRIGWSALSLTNGYTVLEYNLFEECDGDPEIVSVKSCKDTVRYNTFRRCQGTVSLRHGDGSVVNDNFFLGEGKSGTGGVRIYARNHKIYNNYFEGLTGSVWDAAITLTNGDTETGSLSAHWRINNVLIANNSLVNNYSNFEIGYAKADNSWKKEPRNVTIANNLVLGGSKDLIKIYTQPSGFVWEGNIMYPKSGFALGMTASSDQILVTDPMLEFRDSLYLLSSASPAIDASKGSYLNILTDVQGQPRDGVYDVGADEYSNAAIERYPLRPENVGPFSREKPLSVESQNEIAQNFVILTNYPNPFNPSTKIEFSLPRKGNIVLKIYNSLGQEIEELADKVYDAGKYTLDWSTGGLPSGVYIAIIQFHNTVTSRKLLLLK